MAGLWCTSLLLYYNKLNHSSLLSCCRGSLISYLRERERERGGRERGGGREGGRERERGREGEREKEREREEEEKSEEQRKDRGRKGV